MREFYTAFTKTNSVWPAPLSGPRGARGTTTPGGPRAARAEKMAAATGCAAGAAPAGYTGEGRRGAPGAAPAGYTGGGQPGERDRGGSGVLEPWVPRSSGGEVRGAAALAPLPVSEGAPGAGRGRHRAPASPHPLRPQRAPVLRPGEWGWLGTERWAGAREPVCLGLLRAEGRAGAARRTLPPVRGRHRSCFAVSRVFSYSPC